MPTLASQNQHFTWTPAPRRGGRITVSEAEAWDRDGYLLVPGALAADQIAEVAAAIDAEEAKVEARLRADGPHGISAAGKITFTPHIVARAPAARAFAKLPVFADLAADLVGPDVRLYWDQAVYKKTEPERDFPWHQDSGYTFVQPQHYLTCWVPLVDVTVDNGCPWIAPGLHKLGTLKHWWTDLGWRCLEDFPGAIPMEAKAGDIVCFSSLTPHRTGPNVTPDVRKAYILQYAADPTLAFPRGAPSVRQDDPDRQFVVVRDGEAVGAR